MSVKPLRTAIVGTGNIAGIHASSLQQIARETGGVELVAAADTDPARVAEFAAAHSLTGYESVHALLAAEQVDLVHVCTPPGSHTPITLAVLEAGGHVVLEKPATLTLAEFDRLVAAEQATGRHVATISQHRFGSGIRRLRGLLESGAAGRPLLALCDTVWYRDQAYYDVVWRGRWDTEGGGPTMGHGIHQIDTMLCVLGAWTSVSAVARQQARAVDTEDVSLAHVTFENGAVASVVNSVVSPREESYLRFDFEFATVEVRHLYGYGDDDWTVTAAPGHEERVMAAWDRGPTRVRSEHIAQFREIATALHEGVAPPVTTTDARRTLQLAAGIYASAFTRRPVEAAELGADSPHYELMQGNGPVW
ncbi:Gfo/Idh/MocA family protein [Streptomyces odontomachi]|uniref:Gfo/Idh/MocA family protein n=1 Tax=Streptomyces odontomachi TaxID=2944940 RepID=UPI00210EDC28|nr:Gfo/Idh/MocA family oxidoreductase [Streptomyces sp. ODS25]